MDKMMSFDEAVQLVTKDPQQAAFSFYPVRGDGNAVGGSVFAVEFVEDVDEGTSGWLVNRRDGMFHSNSGTEDVFYPDDFGNEFTTLTGEVIDPRALRYRGCDKEAISTSYGLEIQVALGVEEAREMDLNPGIGVHIRKGREDWLVAHIGASQTPG